MLEKRRLKNIASNYPSQHIYGKLMFEAVWPWSMMISGDRL